MKLRNRVLAILLTLAMILSVMPMVFAAEKLTVTLSTPSGNVAYPVAAGSEFTFPEGNNYGDYIFVGWITTAGEMSADFSFSEFYAPGDKVQVNWNVAYYALYGYEQALLTPLFYQIHGDGAADDYTGEFAIVGLDAGVGADGYLYYLHDKIFDLI